MNETDSPWPAHPPVAPASLTAPEPAHPPLADRPPAFFFKRKRYRWVLMCLGVTIGGSYALIDAITSSRLTAVHYVSIPILTFIILWFALITLAMFFDPVEGYRIDEAGLQQVDTTGVFTIPFAAIESFTLGGRQNRIGRIVLTDPHLVMHEKKARLGWTTFLWGCFLLACEVVISILFFRWKRLRMLSLLKSNDHAATFEICRQNLGCHILVSEQQIGARMERFRNLCLAWIEHDRRKRGATATTNA